MQYTTRAIEIIEILFKQSDYITVLNIADKLKISKRTIFRELETVEDILGTYQIEILKKTRVGIKVNATPEQMDQFRLAIHEQVEQVFSQESRLNLLMIELLKSREPKKLFYFADLLKVSEATISNDMDKIEDWFSQRKLDLVRKPGYGVYVLGSENSFRKAIVDFLYQTYEHEDLVQLIQNDFFQSFNESEGQAPSKMLGLIDKDILLKVSLILKDYEALLEKRLAEGAFMGLMIHLAIAIQRINRGESIFMNSAILDSLRIDPHFETAKAIAENIAKVFEIQVPEDEVGYITMHLKGSKLKTSAMSEQHDFIITNFELSRTTAKMIKAFRELSGYDFKDDEKLLIGLASHLRPALTRMKMGLDIRNPLLTKIKEMYPEIYAMTQQTASLLVGKYDIQVPEEEVGFLAMHFGAAIERFRKNQQSDKVARVGVVCSSGIGTSSLLASRLTKLIPKIELVGQFSKEDVQAGVLNEYNIDCLISTIPLETTIYPAIIVNPLLMESDIEKIKQVLALLNQEMKPFKEVASTEMNHGDRLKKINALSSGILELVAGFKVLSVPALTTTEALIKWIGKTFTGTDRDSETLYHQLLEREKLGVTVLRSEGVKLLHAKSEVITHLTFAVLKMEGLNFYEKVTLVNPSGEEKIDLCLLMLLPKDADKNHLEIMSYLSKSIVEDSNLVSALKNDSESQLKAQIGNKLNLWFESQIRA